MTVRMGRGGDRGAAGTARVGAVLTAVSLSMFVVQLDFFALNLALPQMARDLGTTTADLQWVVSANMLALGSMLVVGGRLGDLLGRKRVLSAGLCGFALSALLAAVAGSAAMVIAMRVVQGAAAGLIFPVAIAALANAVPAERRAGAIGAAYGVAALGSAFGPFAGGGLTELLSWRWVFGALVAFGAVAAVLTVALVPDSRDEHAPPRIDVPGILSVVAGVAALTFGIDQVQTWGLADARTLAFMAGGVVLLGAFVAVERRVAAPIVDLRLFANRRFDVIVAMATVANVCFVGMVFVTTLYLQQVRGLSPLAAGVVFLAPAVASGLAGPLAGRLGVRLPARSIMVAANAVGAAGLAGLAAFTGLAPFTLAFFVTGMGLGLGWAFASVGTQAVVRTERAGEASGVMLAIVIGLAGAGVVVVATVLRELQRTGLTESDAIRWILGGLAAVAAFSALTLALAGRSRDHRPSAVAVGEG